MLSELVTTIKNRHTSSPIYHNHNNNRFLKFNKLQNQQSDIVEHQIENTEMFRDLYYFERFEQYQFQNLKSESKRYYQRLIKFTSNWKSLAYYFFENRGWWINVRKDIINIFNQYSSQYSSFTVDNIRKFITNLDVTNSITSSSLHLHYERLKRVTEIAYGINRISYPELKLSSSEQGREENISAINKEEFQNTTKVLYEYLSYEDSLLIYIIWSLAPRPNEMLTIRFEDFEFTNNKLLLK